jgi:hypothetical protein
LAYQNLQNNFDKHDDLIKSSKPVTPAPIFIGINSSRSPDDVPAKAGNHLKTIDSRFHGKPWIPAGVYPVAERGRNDEERGFHKD